MALSNLNGVYNGGAVLFNSNPQTNFLITALAKKQAQKDALDQYYRNVQDRLSDKEVRPQDAEGFNNKVAGIRDYYLRNKQALLKGDIQANSEYNQMYRDAMSDAQKSKAAAQQELLLAQKHFSGHYDPTKEDFDIIGNMGQSIYQKGFYKDGNMTTPYSINDLSFSQPEFTPLQESQLYKGATQGMKPTSKTYDYNNRRVDEQSGYIYTPYTQSYKPEQVQNIAEAYANNLPKSGLIKYENLMHTSAYDQMNKVYQGVYGNDDFIDTPQKMAKAAAILHAQSEVVTGEDKAINAQQRQQMSMARIKYAALLRAGNQQEFYNYKTSHDNDWFDTYVDKLSDDAKNNGGSKVVFEGAPAGYKLTLTPQDRDALKNNGLTPSVVTVTDDGKYAIGYNQLETKNGQTVESDKIDPTKTLVISREQFKKDLGYKPLGKSGLATTMGGGKSETSQTYSIKGKSYTKKQLNDMGYTDDQIQSYLNK